MSKGRNIAITSHIIGVLFALLIVYFVSPYVADLSGFQTTSVRWVLLLLALAWGVYKLVQILRGRDKLANKAKDHFDQRQ